jgi:hypothetical protein
MPRSVVRSLVSTLTTSHARRRHLIVTPRYANHPGRFFVSPVNGMVPFTLHPHRSARPSLGFILCTYLGMGALRAAESVKTEHAAEPKRAERALFAYHSGARLPTLGRGPDLGG